MFLLTSLPLALVALSALFPAVANARAPAGFQYGTDVHLQMPYGNTKVVSPGSRYQISGKLILRDILILLPSTYLPTYLGTRH